MAAYNAKSPAIKRIMSEIKEMQSEQHADFHAAPVEDDLFEWHFTIRGPAGTSFESGRYHGRILLPAEYPFKPPSIMMLSPSGRFETGKKICLSITGYHPEYWQPAWGIRTALLAIISFFPTKAEGAIGGIDWSDEERRVLAKKSVEWTCPTCAAKLGEILPDRVTSGSSSESGRKKDDVDLSMFSLTYAKEKSSAAETAPETAQDSLPDDAQQSTPSATDKGKQKSNVNATPEVAQELRQRATMIHNSPTSSTPGNSSIATQNADTQTPPLHPRQKLIDLLLLFIMLALIPLLLRRLLILITSFSSKLH